MSAGHPGAWVVGRSRGARCFEDGADKAAICQVAERRGGRLTRRSLDAFVPAKLGLVELVATGHDARPRIDK